jgi:hypothetical protein
MELLGMKSSWKGRMESHEKLDVDQIGGEVMHRNIGNILKQRKRLQGAK